MQQKQYNVDVLKSFLKRVKMHQYKKRKVARRQGKNINNHIDRICEKLVEENQVNKRENENFKSFFNTFDDMLFVLDIKGKIIQMNNTAYKRLEYEKEELTQKSILTLIQETRREEVSKIVSSMISDSVKFYDIPLVTKSKKILNVETRIVIGKWNRESALFGVARDIEDTKQEEIINNRFKIKKSVHDLEVLIKGRNGLLHTAIFTTVPITMGNTSYWKTTMTNITQRNLKDKALNISRSRNLNDLITDITESKKKAKEFCYLSYHDELTGVYSRRFYEEELKRLDTDRNFPITIVMGDVNGLKLINDSLGHGMGDKLLKKVANILTKACRTDDIIARLGGDEFVILLPKTGSFEAKQIINRISALSQCEKVGPIDISISFGFDTKISEDDKVEEIFKNAEDNMYKKKLFEGSNMRAKAIKAIINTLYKRNNKEEQHSHRVAELCSRMGEILKLSSQEIQELRSAGLFHDIGKVAIDESILNKSGKLTEVEWKNIKRHCEIGYRILSTVNDLSDVADYVLAHHERWDGKGYPRSLKQDQIPFVSRIVSIANAYDVMTNDETYRRVLSTKGAIQELRRNAGIKFDPKLVNIFIERVLPQSIT